MAKSFKILREKMGADRCKRAEQKAEKLRHQIDGGRKMAFDDEFGYHEVLHTAHIMTCMWSEHIQDHGAVATNPALKAEAERIGKEIASFYKAVLDATDERFGKE